MVKAEKDHQAVKDLTGILIAREDINGLKFVMDRFQSGLLLGEEVTEILGRNVKFSINALSAQKDIHANAIQISELSRCFPLETGIIVPGLYVKTPIGWAKIDLIMNRGGKIIKSVARDDKSVVFKLTFDYGHPSVKCVLDLQDGLLSLLGSTTYYQCGKCNFISDDETFIVRHHNRYVHNGIGPSFRKIPLKMHIYGDLQLSAEKTNWR